MCTPATAGVVWSAPTARPPAATAAAACPWRCLPVSLHSRRCYILNYDYDCSLARSQCAACTPHSITECGKEVRTLVHRPLSET